MSDATRNYAAAIIASKEILTIADLEFLTHHAEGLEAKIWWIRAARTLKQYGLTLSPTAQTFEKEAWIEITNQLKARDRYVFWEETNRSFYSQNERLSAIILEEMMYARKNTELQHKAARYLTETKAQHLSGNSSIRILKTMKKYAENYEIGSIGAKFSVKDNLAQTLVQDQLPELSSENVSEKLLTDTQFQSLTFTTENDKPFYADVELHEVFPVEKVSPVSKGFFLERGIYDIADTQFETPLKTLKQGNNYIVRMRIVTNASHRQIALLDHAPAGAEFINFEFDNADKTLRNLVQDEQCYGWCRPNFNHQEFHETAARFFADYIGPGTHEVKYLIRARMTGDFEVMPAKIEEMYFPEVFATTNGEKIMIKE